MYACRYWSGSCWSTLDGGAFSAPTAEQLAETACAPVHNMFAERTLGKTDALIRKAPNASLCYVEGLISFRTNNTLEWLLNHPSSDSMVSLAVTEGRGAKARAKTEMEKLHQEEAQRQEARAKGREKRQFNIVQKVARQLLGADGLDPGMVRSQLAESADAPVSEAVVAVAYKFLSAPSDLVYTKVVHTCNNETFNGRILKVKKDKKSVQVGYWSMEETECDAVDKYVTVASIVASLVFNEFHLC